MIIRKGGRTRYQVWHRLANAHSLSGDYFLVCAGSYATFFDACNNLPRGVDQLKILIEDRIGLRQVWPTMDF
jgi:hypothetical protein